MMSATPRQLDLLRFIYGYQLAHGGISPTLDECGAGIGLKARSGVHRLICGLQERGYLRTMPGRARAMAVIAPPAIPTIAGTPLYVVPLGVAA